MNENERQDRLDELVNLTPRVTKEKVEYINGLLANGTIRTPREFLRFFGGNESEAKNAYTAFLNGHGGSSRVRDIIRTLSQNTDERATMHQRALSEYDTLQELRSATYNRLTDLGEQQGNAPTEEFDGIKSEIANIDERIAAVGKRIAETALVTYSEPTSQQEVEETNVETGETEMDSQSPASANRTEETVVETETSRTPVEPVEETIEESIDASESERQARLNEAVNLTPRVTREKVAYINGLLANGTIRTPREFLRFFGGNESEAKNAYTAFLNGHGGSSRVRDIMRTLSQNTDENRVGSEPVAYTQPGDEQGVAVREGEPETNRNNTSGVETSRTPVQPVEETVEESIDASESERQARLNEAVNLTPRVTREKVAYINGLLANGTIRTPREFLRFFGGNESEAKNAYTAFLNGHGGSSRVRDIMRTLSQNTDENRVGSEPVAYTQPGDEQGVAVREVESESERARVYQRRNTSPNPRLPGPTRTIGLPGPTTETTATAEENTTGDTETNREDVTETVSPRLPGPTRTIGLPGPTTETTATAEENTTGDTETNREDVTETVSPRLPGPTRTIGLPGPTTETTATAEENTTGDTETNREDIEQSKQPASINVGQTNANITQTGTANQNGGINIANVESISSNNAQSPETNTQQMEESDPRNIEYQRIYDEANAEYEAAQARVQESIREMQRIFAEERRIRTEDGPFRTVQELDNFTAEYMRQKIEEDERLTNARTAMKIAENKMRTAERRIHDYATAKEEAARLGIPVEEYERIRKASAKREVLQEVYDREGLGEVTRRTKEGKEQAELTTDEIINMVVEQMRTADSVNISQGAATISQNGIINQNGNVNIVIIDTLNITDGQDTPVRIEGARTTQMTVGEKDNVKVKTLAEPRLVPRRGNEPETTNPGPAPSDMIDASVNVDQTNANITQTGTINQNGGINIANVGNITMNGNSSISQSNPNTNNDDSNNAGRNDDNGQGENHNPDEIKYGFNDDGTYRLKKEDIIQDDLSTPENDSPTQLNPNQGKKPGQTPGVEPDPNQGKKPNPTIPGARKPSANKRGLLTIMDEITDGLDLGKKDGKRYRASNIKVAKNFAEELQSGNYLYNIVHLVPAIVKLPINLLRKVSGKIMLGSEAKENIAKLQERINGLNEDDLMTIYEEYRGNRVIQERFPTILNTLLEDRIQRFALGKVTEINSELELRYQSAFSAIRQLEAIDAQLANPQLDAKTRTSLQSARALVFDGQANNIAAIRTGYVEANGWLSGGSHGFSEDMKAATTKLSCIGKRFAKDHDLDGDLLHRQAQLEQLEMKALAAGDNETALRAFVESERLLSDNTEINNSLFGKRSTGKKYYSPLVEQLDYRDDPFLRDLFTTIAVTSAAVSATRAFQQAQNGGLTPEQAAAIQRNEAMMKQVNDYGKQIADSRGTMMEGMKAQNVQDTLTASNEIERATLDSTDWGLGTSAYRAADNAGHTFYNDLYDSTEGAINAITSRYAQGAITQSEAMEMMAELSANTQATLQNVTKECLDILQPYAATHPQFDLTGVESAMQYMVQNPTAIAEMNQAMVDAAAIGDTLSKMQLEHIAALQTMPSNVQSYFLTCASSAALAANVANTAQGARKHNYGNSVTDMVEEYSETQQTTQSTGRSK
ncbi:MAG: hypothetical protein Q4F33_00235 [Mycoplasmatota bacterium]|nr:hypothetical protein [Mycoplasmatota bacterium]